MSRYLNPFTDFGFKKLFGTEKNADLLISFLNEVLPDRKIAEITFRKTEHLGQTDLDRKVIYDLYCESETGEKFIVELQKAKQAHFRDRTLYYSTFPIQEQAQKGDWNYELKAIYTVAILDFVFEDDPHEVKLTVKLMNTHKKTIFYEKLTFVYLQMPYFKKNLEELQSLEDKWLYLLRNLADLQNRPVALQERIFDKLFQEAEVGQFNPDERKAYEDSLKYYRDVKNSLDTAFEDGKMEGKMEGYLEGEQWGVIKGKMEIALNLLKKGVDLTTILEVSGLTIEQIEDLKKKL